MAKHANIETVDENDLDDELVELEFDEESVAYYIVDEDDNEIGVCLIEDGEEIEKGLALVLVDGYALGFVKADQSMKLKNLYNKGWRMV